MSANANWYVVRVPFSDEPLLYGPLADRDACESFVDEHEFDEEETVWFCQALPARSADQERMERYAFKTFASAYAESEEEARAAVQGYFDRDEAQHAGLSLRIDPDAPVEITTETEF